MASEDIITKIPFEQWPLLRDMYLVDYPKDLVSYFVIDSAFKSQDRDEESQIYTLNNDYNDGAFLYVNRKSGIVIFNTLGHSVNKVQKITNILGDMRLVFVIFTSPMLVPLVQNLETLAGGHYKSDPGSLFFMDKEKALKLDIPERDDVVLKPLTENDAETVNEFWIHRSQRSFHFVKDLIRTDFSIGAFSSTTGELLAWVLRYSFGGFAMLRVRNEFHRKGLGSLVTTAMAKMLAENGLDSAATVRFTNTASRNLFKSIGFEEMYEVFIYKRID